MASKDDDDGEPDQPGKHETQADPGGRAQVGIGRNIVARPRAHARPLPVPDRFADGTKSLAPNQCVGYIRHLAPPGHRTRRSRFP